MIVNRLKANQKVENCLNGSTTKSISVTLDVSKSSSGLQASLASIGLCRYSLSTLEILKRKTNKTGTWIKIVYSPPSWSHFHSSFSLLSFNL